MNKKNSEEVFLEALSLLEEIKDNVYGRSIDLTELSAIIEDFLRSQSVTGKIAISLSDMASKFKRDKIEKDEYKMKFLPDVEDFEKFVRGMTDAQKTYADQYLNDDRFTEEQKRQLVSMRDLDWRGKYKSSSAFLVEMRKAIIDYNEFTAINMIKLAKVFNKFKYCLARESGVAVYIKGFTSAVEVADLAKAFKKIGADEISLVKGNSTLWAEWSNNIYGLEEYANEDLKQYELRIWWD